MLKLEFSKINPDNQSIKENPSSIKCKRLSDSTRWSNIFYIIYLQILTKMWFGVKSVSKDKECISVLKGK